MVRLKATYGGIPEIDYVFQFLMVRLKETFLTRTIFVNFISIPYGSIKSRKTMWLIQITDISIPYGSIKRIEQPLFQWAFFISIPYGSIKSCQK